MQITSAKKILTDPVDFYDGSFDCVWIKNLVAIVSIEKTQNIIEPQMLDSD